MHDLCFMSSRVGKLQMSVADVIQTFLLALTGFLEECVSACDIPIVSSFTKIL